MVPPMLIPRICVCTAPDAATAQTSLFMVVTAGATAVGGGDLTVVVLLFSVMLLDVLSVLIVLSVVCASTDNELAARIADTIIFFIFFAPWVTQNYLPKED
jgi:hypothetical protein